MRGWIVPGRLALLILTLLPGVASGQELSLLRQLPPEPAQPCAVVASAAYAAGDVPEQDRDEANRLAGQASQAAILGDRVRAQRLLEDAAELDPMSASIAYRLGRVLEAAGTRQAALAQFCRYLALAPEGGNSGDEGDSGDVRQRIARLSPPPEGAMSEAARSAFVDGIARFDAGEFEAAVRGFSRALAAAPDWDQAHFNRGLAYLRLGHEEAGIADLERYLALRPDATDREQVEDRLAALSSDPARVSTVQAQDSARPPAGDQPQTEASTARAYSASTALLTGLLVPGMGHVYLDRPGSGALIFLAAGGSLAAGLLYTEVQIDCLAVPEEGGCPPDQILGREETRPRLVYGLAAAGVITLASALHAFFSADQPEPVPASGLGIVLPLHGQDGNGAPVLTLDPVVRGGAGFAAAVRVPVP